MPPAFAFGDLLGMSCILRAATFCAGTKSQSTRCVPYVFNHKTLDGRDVNVHIIDTPGLSDTEGTLVARTCLTTAKSWSTVLDEVQL